MIPVAIALLSYIKITVFIIVFNDGVIALKELDIPTLSLPDRIKVIWLLLVDFGLELYGLF